MRFICLMCVFGVNIRVNSEFFKLQLFDAQQTSYTLGNSN